MRSRTIVGLCSLMLLLSFTPTLAQDSVPPAEPDTEAFISSNFILQDTYSRVLCVSQDGSCVAEVTTAVPCFVAACAHPAQTYPVSQNFDTIQNAALAAQAGDLIIIMPGRYAGVEIELTGGTDGAYIHFLGWGAPGSIIVNGPADPSKSYLRHHFYFIAAHHYIVQNIAFENAENGAGVFFSGYFAGTGQFAHHFIATDIYSHDNFKWGLHTTSASYLLIQDSVFTGSQDEHGMYLSGSGDHILVRRNVFQGNIASGLQINADPQTAIMEIFYWLQEATGDTCGLSEDEVDFTGSAQWQDIKACYDSQGLPDLGEFIEDGIGEDIIIENNVMTGNGEVGGAAINLASIRNTTIRNNLVYGNFAGGITCWDNAYAEEKGLASSEFGCADVRVFNNTIVDESGDRGGLIILNDARNFQVFNNIVIRDRFDAYEISYRSSEGLQTGHNYYSERYEEETPPASAEQNSITGFSVQEGLSQFVNANFEPWIIEDGVWFSLNPNRPNYRPIGGSVLNTGGNPNVTIMYDLDGVARIGTEIGAYSGTLDGIAAPPDTGESPQNPPPTEAASIPDSPLSATGGTVTFSVDNGHVYRIEATPGAQAEDITAQLPGDQDGMDVGLNVSPNGAWLVMESDRFDPECAGWACAVLISADLSSVEVLKADGAAIHPDSFSAVSNDGNMVIFDRDGGPHAIDLFVTTRQDSGWSSPVALTSESPYQWHRSPAISDDGTRVVFNCGDEPYSHLAICEVNTDGTGFRVVLTPDNAPAGLSATDASLFEADYAPDGSIVFEGDWGGEQIWRLPPNASEPVLINPNFTNDNSPCVMPDGRIVSLWLNRPEGQGFHELKIMNADGSGDVMLVVNVDIFAAGIGCGG